MKSLVELGRRELQKFWLRKTRRGWECQSCLLGLVMLLAMPIVVRSQTITAYPNTVIAPKGSYQTVSFPVTGLNNKGVSFTTDCGTIVGQNPFTVNETATVALYYNSTGTCHLTGTTTGGGSLTATSTITFTASPTPTTGHPRLIVTAPMLAGLQAKTANAATVEYTQTLSVASIHYTADASLGTFSTWSGSACTGGSWPSASQTGNGDIFVDPNYFSWISMVAPTSAARNQYGCAGRDMWVYAMTNAISGAINLVGNVWSDQATNLILTGDWLMGGGYLSASDIVLQRQFNAYVMKYALAVAGGYGYTPAVAAYNNPVQWANPSSCPSYAPCNLTNMRAMGNNYTYSRDMIMVGMGLMFDDNTTDDPPLTNTCSATRYQLCPDFTGGSLHAYFNYFAGSLLYLTNAHLEDPNVIQQEYNAAYSNVPAIPTCQLIGGSAIPCFGDGRGGESSEGSWYQYSLVKLRYAMNMLYTTGYNDPLIWGPQMSLPTSSFWDMKDVSDLEFMTGFVQSNGGVGGGQPTYSFLTTGDTLTYYRAPADFEDEAATLTFDTYTGRSDRTNILLWPIFNTAFGGPHGTNGACVYYCGFDFGYGIVDAGLQVDLLIDLPAGDPLNSLPASDPRPTLPIDLYNGSFNQHQMIRNGWTGANANSVFTYNCSQGQINHEDIACGAFSVYTGNEYIAKTRVVFNDYNAQMNVASQQNEMQVQNPAGSGASGIWAYPATQGGQFFQGQQTGMTPLLHSELPTYAADIADNANDYNGWYSIFNLPYDTPSYNAIASASRSLIYLRGANQVIYADRAATTGAATAMSTNLTTTGTPTISGTTASWPTRSGTQKGCFTNVSPGVTITAPGLIAGGADQAGDWEPASVINASAGSVTSAFMVNLLTWGASGTTCPSAGAVSSSSGQAFSGTVQGDNLVLFSQTYPLTFTGTTFPASSALAVYVADLVPNTSYPITGAGTPSTATSDTAGVLEFAATGTGSITVGSGTPQAATPTFSPTAGTYAGAQSVTISTSSSGAILCYNTTGSPATNGSTGCTTGTLYSTPVSVATSETLYAVAGGTGYSDSTGGSAAYTITAAVSGVVQSGVVSSGAVTQ